VRPAVRWLKANAAAQGIDPGRICLWGTSAGGHLAAVAGLAPAGTFEEKENLEQTSAVRCVRDAYGRRASIVWMPRVAGGCFQQLPSPGIV
jgi:hypothetical protein